MDTGRLLEELNETTMGILSGTYRSRVELVFGNIYLDKPTRVLIWLEYFLFSFAH